MYKTNLYTIVWVPITLILLFIGHTSTTLSKSDKKSGKSPPKPNSGKPIHDKWQGPIERNVYERGKLQAARYNTQNVNQENK